MRALVALALALLAQRCVSAHASTFQRQRVAIQHAEYGITTVARRFSAGYSRGLAVSDWRILQDGASDVRGARGASRYSHRTLGFFLMSEAEITKIRAQMARLDPDTGAVAKACGGRACKIWERSDNCCRSLAARCVLDGTFVSTLFTFAELEEALASTKRRAFHFEDDAIPGVRRSALLLPGPICTCVCTL
jgi:hypothetical protein